MAVKYLNLDLASGSNDGTTKADAWQSLADMVAGMAAGDDIRGTGGETLSAAVDLGTTAGTVADPITLTAYDATLTTPTPGAIVIDCNGTSNPFLCTPQSIFVMVGVEAHNSGAAMFSISGGDGLTLKDCYFHDGVDFMSASNESINIFGCTVDTFSGYGIISFGSDSHIIGNIFSNITGDFINTSRTFQFIGNLVFNLSSYGIYYTGTVSCTISDNTFHKVTGNAIEITTGSVNTGVVIRNNRITNGSAWGIVGAAGALIFGDYNAFYLNDSGEKSIATYIGGDNDVSMSSAGYLDTTSKVYNLKQDAEARNIAVKIGCSF
jgi:hypothetical protein